MSLASLAQLKKIRSRRMEQQLVTVQEHRRHIQQCQEQVRQAKEALNQFQQWRLQQQEANFKNLQSQPFTPEAMRDYQAEVENLRLQEQHHAQKITQAEEALTAAQKAFEAERQKANALTLKHEKTQEIMNIEQQNSEKLTMRGESSLE